jgi:hypothetical protein
MSIKTLKELYKAWREGHNTITGEPNLFRDLTDQIIWDNAYEAGRQEETDRIYKIIKENMSPQDLT